MPTNKRFAYIATVGLPIVLCASATLAAPPAMIVDTTDDAIAIDGACSLREAVENANDGAQTHPDCARPKGNLARIDLTNPGGDTIELTDSLDMEQPVEITGPGSHALTITRATPDSGSHFRVATTMTLTGVRLTEAGSHGSITAGDYGFGSPPYTLALSDVVFSANTANGSATGGAAVNLSNGASATIHDSKFFDNHTAFEGGAISVWGGGSLTVGDSVFANNMASGNGGAVMAFASDVAITGSVFVGNEADVDGGAVAIFASDGTFDTTISNSTIVHNSAGSDGGGYYGHAITFGTLDTLVTGSVIARNLNTSGLDDVYLNTVGAGAHNYTEVNSIVDNYVCNNC